MEICAECGEKCEPDGWDLSMVEKMCAYRVLTGLPPIGPHRKYIDQLELCSPCESCRGRGLIDVNNGRGYRWCQECGGLGAILKLSAIEMKKVRIEAERIFRKECPEMDQVKFTRPQRSWISAEEMKRVFYPRPVAVVRVSAGITKPDLRVATMSKKHKVTMRKRVVDQESIMDMLGKNLCSDLDNFTFLALLFHIATDGVSDESVKAFKEMFGITLDIPINLLRLHKSQLNYWPVFEIDNIDN